METQHIYNAKIMRRPLEVWQFVVALLGLGLMSLTIIINLTSRVAILQEQIVFLQQNKITTEAQFHEVNSNLKEISGTLTTIQITLQNKQDRK